ncbi:MAG: Na+/H+ antiporter subunit E [Synergistaceae bacterium]|jgi:multicomponent Na+:H+ antiporter subunit E|nr:Na+/H+ antiporter subunit E [Synergistaceae bacterium]
MVIFVVSFFTYLFLSGGWTVQEVTLAFLVSAIVAFVFSGWSKTNFWSTKGLDPRRWWLFARYLCGPFAVALALANWDVAKRVITGDINPGIVKFNPRLKTDLGRMLLANSITLTPGTLTVDIDENGTFYIHALNLSTPNPSEADICGPFGQWARRITE